MYISSCSTSILPSTSCVGFYLLTSRSWISIQIWRVEREMVAEAHRIVINNVVDASIRSEAIWQLSVPLASSLCRFVQVSFFIPQTASKKRLVIGSSIILNNLSTHTHIIPVILCMFRRLNNGPPYRHLPLQARRELHLCNLPRSSKRSLMFQRVRSHILWRVHHYGDRPAQPHLPQLS